MRIVIAEDELLERKAMKKFLEENFTDITVVGEAVHGRSAIELAERLKPDAMLVDIKMPGISGIEAIKEITQLDSSIKFILVTAYDSFDYAKQAMKLGVKEYILKPSNKEETVRAIKRVQKELKDETALAKHQQHSIGFAKKHFLSKLTHYDLSKEVFELKNELFPDMKCGFFFVIKGKQDKNMSMLEESIKKHIEDSCIFQGQAQQIVLLFLPQIHRTKADILKMARKMHLALGAGYFIGAGYPYAKLGDLPKSYHQALTAVDHFVHHNHVSYGFPRIEGASRKETAEQVITEIEAGNEQGATHYFNLFYEGNTTAGRGDAQQELFYKIKQTLENKGITPPDKWYNQFHMEEDWITFIKLCCLNVQHHYQSQRKMERAKTFIYEHFDQAITLEEVAEYVDLSTNYFSHLFKRATGETFIDYLTQTRLKKAKTLIQASQYNLKEISFMVGYKDPNYFSRVFKKYFEISPKQYQQEIFEK